MQKSAVCIAIYIISDGYGNNCNDNSNTKETEKDDSCYEDYFI